MPDPIQLGLNRIFILPTKAGAAFTLLLLTMLLISINYNNPPGYLLTFLLTGVGLASIFHTHRTLYGLRIEHEPSRPVFVGQTARFTLLVHVPKTASRHGIKISWTRLGPGQTQSALPTAATRFTLSAPALVRGRFEAGPCVVSTIHPLGLFRAWSILYPAMACIVYPQPEKNGPGWPRDVFSPKQAFGAETLATVRENGEDFSGLRAYRFGDSPRQVAWKATARSQTMYSKDFLTQANDKDIWLQWVDADQQDAEATISRLCRWVLEAEKTDYPFGLILPGQTFAPGRGQAHKDHCLTALALLKPIPQ